MVHGHETQLQLFRGLFMNTELRTLSQYATRVRPQQNSFIVTCHVVIWHVITTISRLQLGAGFDLRERVCFRNLIFNNRHFWNSIFFLFLVLIVWRSKYRDSLGCTNVLILYCCYDEKFTPKVWTNTNSEDEEWTLEMLM